MNFWIINTLNGLSLAMILFLLAAGLTLIFGLMRIINMAHGSFYLLGGYIAISAIRFTGDFGTGALLAVVAVAVAGVIVQRLFLARLYKQEMPQALLTLGLFCSSSLISRSSPGAAIRCSCLSRGCYKAACASSAWSIRSIACS